MPCSHCKLSGHNVRTCPLKNVASSFPSQPMPAPMPAKPSAKECPICYCEIESKNSATTPCGHDFCFECIAHALQENTNCPMCREQLAPPNEKVYTRDEHLAEMDSSYHEGYREGVEESRFIEAQNRDIDRQAQDSRWQEHLDVEVQRNYERGIVEGRSIANEHLRMMRSDISRLVKTIDKLQKENSSIRERTNQNHEQTEESNQDTEQKLKPRAERIHYHPTQGDMDFSDMDDEMWIDYCGLVGITP